jgi:hypothetical protein
VQRHRLPKLAVQLLRLRRVGHTWDMGSRRSSTQASPQVAPSGATCAVMVCKTVGEHRIRKQICKRDGTRQGGTAETSRAWCDFDPLVCPGQRDIQRRPETAEMRVVVLITQRSRVQIPPPLPRSEADSEQGVGLLRTGC